MSFFVRVVWIQNVCAKYASRQLLDLMNKWELKTDVLKPGFAIWYSAQGFDKKELDILEQRRLLFPCYYFDHAEGFARATRFLAYRVSGHIQEDNPIEHDKLHLPVFTTRECPSD